MKFHGTTTRRSMLLKSFATLRRVFGGSSTERGIQDYLVLLSVCETCRYRGINFWEIFCVLLQRRGAYAKVNGCIDAGYQDKHALKPRNATISESNGNVCPG